MWQHDARNIPLCRTCDDCHDTKMAGYRPDVLTDSNYWTDEEVEPEPEVGKPEYGSQQWAETYSDDLGESPDY